MLNDNPRVIAEAIDVVRQLEAPTPQERVWQNAQKDLQRIYDMLSKLGR